MQCISKHTLFFLICYAAMEVDSKNGFKIKTQHFIRLKRHKLLLNSAFLISVNIDM